MPHRRLLTLALCLAFVFPIADHSLAAGGTSVVATKGQAAYVSPTWPEGVGELVNHPLRTSGWNSWFTEWPNDVNQYAFEIKSTDDLNRLITRLAAIKTDCAAARRETFDDQERSAYAGAIGEAPGADASCRTARHRGARPLRQIRLSHG